MPNAECRMPNAECRISLFFSMPLYEYRCKDDGTLLELMRPMSQADAPVQDPEGKGCTFTWVMSVFQSGGQSGGKGDGGQSSSQSSGGHVHSGGCGCGKPRGSCGM